MVKPNNRNFPAVVIYNVDSEDIAGAEAGQTVVFMREENSDAHKDEWIAPLDPRTGIDFSESYTAP